LQRVLSLSLYNNMFGTDPSRLCSPLVCTCKCKECTWVLEQCTFSKCIYMRLYSSFISRFTVCKLKSIDAKSKANQMGTICRCFLLFFFTGWERLGHGCTFQFIMQ
jgi:hypothetical protein